ncbi:M23 family metallopeptidase [Hyphococcus sp.]|uniref:M23 family metallopeptidase n=1 Tax=Hyphococcus sp. TaxID=2038636 RepID=UPI0037535520
MQVGVFASSLSLCNGSHIDNAPAIDSEKNIINYRSMAHVAGITVARAPVRRACFSSGFGSRHDRVGLHKGIDLSTGHPHAVYAASYGVIEEIRTMPRYGNMILIKHRNGVKTRYAHLSTFDSRVHQGHEVRQGDVIGMTGSSGNANAVVLHYEIIVNGVPQNPMTIGD